MSDERQGAGGGLSVQTLVISSLSAVAATVIVSQFWESGTLFFTAMVPIVVALVSEALKRPAEKITRVAPLVVPARRSPTGTAVYEEAPGEREVPQESRRALPEHDDPFGLYERDRARGGGRRWLKVGLVTGLAAFLIGAAAVTASELAIFGGSVGGGDRRTTYFGGEEKPDTSTKRDQAGERSTPDREATPAPDEEATPTPDEEATPAPTETPQAPGESPTPVPTATPPPATTPPPAEEDPAAP